LDGFRRRNAGRNSGLTHRQPTIKEPIMATLNIDTTNIDTAPRFDPLPAGDYPVIISESETRLTKDGSGQYLQIKLEVQSGEFAGRTLFDRLNLWNNNRQAQEIAQRSLSQICHAVGVMQVNDSQELHHKPLIATVKVRPARDNYEASNEIKGYKASAAIPVAQQPFAAPRAPAAPAPTGFAAGGAAPWMHKAA
jgi:Protein of unknown function (DUF669)